MAAWLTKLRLRSGESPRHRRDRTSSPGPSSLDSQPWAADPSPAAILTRRDYMTVEHEAEVFVLGADRMPTGSLQRRADRLVIVPDACPDEIVNPRSRRLYRLGIYSFGLRGAAHHADAIRAANLRPGKPVLLVREPDNDFDENAIAVYPMAGQHKIGYVNRLNARRLAPMLDAGSDFVAISTRGSGPGSDESPVMILVARRDVLSHLRRSGE